MSLSSALADRGRTQLLQKSLPSRESATSRTYGYRRMWPWPKSRNIFCNPKTVLRIMKKHDLLSDIRRRRKWQQMGQQVHKYKNLPNREFHADKPNSKWVTDISCIHARQGVLYLSMIRELYGNRIVAYKTETQQTVNLVWDTIRLAMKREKKRPPRSCSSTATRDFSIPLRRTSTWPKHTALHRPYQDEEIRMKRHGGKFLFHPQD